MMMMMMMMVVVMMMMMVVVVVVVSQQASEPVNKPANGVILKQQCGQKIRCMGVVGRRLLCVCVWGGGLLFILFVVQMDCFLFCFSCFRQLHLYLSPCSLHTTCVHFLFLSCLQECVCARDMSVDVRVCVCARVCVYMSVQS
ncbi:hypothetical protein PTSG_12603 [Salpingoeca rosetta]|uniref:Secreted protein n=1 Tax=Salpingoeca rosetta (strain ATCC 50818 / BSB-021) TaxID=946362 RepID=F2UH24_SALR5|nr:uncharacterized protein PTSG_12603 [Salpingoeca rosetta]EGD76423.1 hypothetical protein PTSG_12603 [Salpingoeca rosetta]|eukprot:XP_004991338.1 hypothetical protein PTSG_12603 [Salpingoeca rosetta]